MSGKFSKKGRNPQLVDNWLDSIDLYRKSVAYDETCLFRAISEQLFNCQVYHERVRNECIDYGRAHFTQFTHLVKEESEWLHHLDLLHKHMVVCGQIEIFLASHKYERDVLIVCANQQEITNVTKRCLKTEPLMLCLMDGDHYDAVYKKEHIINAGFCQSLVYKMLYEDVFKIENVDSIVNAMLYEKVPIINQAELEDKNDQATTSEEVKSEGAENVVVAPFPFKVAKALDPTIYRNIEYDSWNDVRKELRLGDWYRGDDKLKLGTKCVLKDNNTGERLDCYIQQFHQDHDKCIVYITRMAEKRLVKYTDLAPENNAQPWPLPYRFAKNATLHAGPKLASMDKVRAMRKKNKEAKQQSKSMNDLTTLDQNGINSVSGYVGVPLQMHNPSPESKMEELNDSTRVNLTVSDGLITPITPESCAASDRFQWDQVNNNWNSPLTSLQFTTQPEASYYHQQSEQTQSNPFYDYKPMVASAPVTPNVVSYHDTSYPVFFNYHLQQYPQYPPLTPPTPITLPTNQFSDCMGEMVESGCQRVSRQCSMDLRNVVQPVECNGGYQPRTPQPMDVYSPMVNLQSGPSVIYTPVPPPNVTMVVPASPIAPYGPSTPVPPPGYVYSPNPPPTEAAHQVQWYPHHNSQGFIFPTPTVQER